MDFTTDPALRSFVPIAPESHFPIQNLPYGVFRPKSGGAPRVGVAIGEFVLDLALLEEQGLLTLPGGLRIFKRASLNAFMARPRAEWRRVRETLSNLLNSATATLRDNQPLREKALLRQADVEMLLPVEIGDYTDFYSSREHATNVGVMLRGKDNALNPNWLHLPVGYHGRSSSIVISGTDLKRPHGQTKADDAEAPTFGPSRNVDFELELGFFIGEGNALGEAVPVARAMDRVFGLALVNDWSARDIQKWEYVPLGPFLAKNFGTSISPWIVSLDALAPFQTPPPAHNPTPLPYLQSSAPTYDIKLEVLLQGAKMEKPQRICASNFKHLYWTMAQQLAHHTVNGCNLRTGDLLASGTISGPTPDSFGSLLELCWKGTKPLQFPNGETRTFIQDHDRITMTGWCEGNGYRVGFGEVTGRILPAAQ